MGRFEIIDAVIVGDLASVKAQLASDRGLAKAADVEGKSVLYLAILEGHNDIAEHLITQGADVNGANPDGQTPLMMAAAWDRLPIVDQLIAAGATVAAKTLRSGACPLHFAADRGREEVARRLLASGADPNQRKDDGWSPLHTAAYFGRLTTAKVLLDGGADLQMTANDGKTPLDCARAGYHKEVEEFLASYRANRSSRGRWWWPFS